MAVKYAMVREEIANLAHEQWSGWIRYLFDKSVWGDDGTVTIPADLVLRWERQMQTPYTKLSPKEQDSARAVADKILALIGDLSDGR